MSLTRRSFAESLALAALGPFIGVRPESIRLRRWDKAVPMHVTDPGALAKALTEVIRTQYSARLSSGDLETIARQIQTGLERVDQMKKLPLANGDEPDFVFSATRRTPPVP